MIYILKLGKTINFVQFEPQEFRQILKNTGICQDVYKSNGEIETYADDKWLWEHRYMFLTFRSFHTINEAMEFISNSVTIQDEIRDENLVIANTYSK